jgi:hypothetical protein
MVQMNDARRWRNAIDGFKHILSCNDQSWPGILQHLDQPVAWIMRIQCNKGTPGRQASHYGEGIHRTRRQQYADEVSGPGFCRNSFG